MSHQPKAPVTPPIQTLVALALESLKTYSTPAEAEQMVADFVEKETQAALDTILTSLRQNGDFMESRDYHEKCGRLWALVSPRDGLPCDVILAQEHAAIKEKLSYAESEWQAQAQLVKEACDRESQVLADYHALVEKQDGLNQRYVKDLILVAERCNDFAEKAQVLREACAQLKSDYYQGKVKLPGATLVQIETALDATSANNVARRADRKAQP